MMMMRLRLRRSGMVRQAITDVYDERRGAFLVQYPVWLILALGLAGVAAFAITGFVGGAPLVLYAWFCALVIALQASIFRHASMRARLVATLTVTVLAVLVVGLAQFGNVLPDSIKQSINYGELANSLANNALTYTVLNFGLLAIFWVDTVRRWVRRARGLAPNPRVTLSEEEAQAEAARQAREMPSLEELISGDLIAAFVLAGALSLLFQLDIVKLIVHGNGIVLDRCTVSLPAPLAACAPGGDQFVAPTLTFYDRIQALIYLPLGLIILALTAMLSGLGAAGGVGGTARPAEPAVGTARPSSSSAIAEDVAGTLLMTLRSALDRRLRHLASNLALSLRTVAWPALILLAVYGLSEIAIRVERYLPTAKGASEALFIMGPALLWGLVAALAVAFSAALLVFRWRVADNTLRFLGLIGFVVLLTFWLFSLALAGFNFLLKDLLAVTPKTPFLPVGTSTAISAVALVAYGSYALIRRGRSTQAPQESGELVGVGVQETTE